MTVGYIIACRDTNLLCQFSICIFFINRPLSIFFKPLFQSEAKCEAIDMKMSKTDFHKFSQQRFCSYPRFERGSFWNLEMAYFNKKDYHLHLLLPSEIDKKFKSKTSNNQS